MIDAGKISGNGITGTINSNFFDVNAEIKTNEFVETVDKKIKEYNDNADARMNEYNNTADGLMNIATDTRNELERVKNDVLETGEANGNYLTLNDSTMAELQELEVNSVEKQKTTTGKNLINILSTNTTITGSGCSYTRDNDGKMTVKGTTNRAWDYTISEPITFEAGETYSLSIPIFAKTSTSSDVVFYINLSDANGGRLSYDSRYFKSGKPVVVSIKETETQSLKFSMGANIELDFTVGIQLEKGNLTEIPIYEPFTGLKPSPSPDYPQKIPMITIDSVLKSVGKNLFDYIGSILTSYYGTTSTKENNGFKGGHGYYVSINKLFKKGTYTISFKVKDSDGSDYGNFSLLDNSNNTVINFAFNHTSSTNKKTITIDEDVFISKIKIDNRKQLTTQLLYDLQIEKGDKATPYEPYQETILNMPIPEGEFVGYINDNAKDTLRVGYNEEDGNYHLYLDKMLGKVVLNGSENWGKSGSSTDKYFVGALANANLTNVFKTNKNTILISHFNKSGITGSEECFSLYNANSEGIFQAFALSLGVNKATALDEFKTWLATNNVEVVYILANPYTLDLGIVDMPLSYDGVTNIFVDTDLLMNINTKYYRNFTETIRNLQINNDTLKNELASIESRLTALEVAKASVVNESEVVE